MQKVSAFSALALNYETINFDAFNNIAIIIRTQRRSTMSQDCLSPMSIMNIESDLTVEFSPDNTVSLFANDKHRLNLPQLQAGKAVVRG